MSVNLEHRKSEDLAKNEVTKDKDNKNEKLKEIKETEKENELDQTRDEHNIVWL